MNTAQTDQRMPNQDRQQIKPESVKNTRHSTMSNIVPTRINSDDQTKLKVCCYPTIFIVILIVLSIIASLALPNALRRIDPNIWKEGNIIKICNNHLYLDNKTIKCSETNSNYTTIGSYVSNLVPLNQFLVLYLSIDKGFYQKNNINLNEIVKFQLYIAQTVDGQIVVTNQIAHKNLSLVGRIHEVFDEEKLFIVYMSKLNKEQEYYWQLEFSNNSQLAPSSYFLESQIVNEQFSIFTISLRVVLFVISLVVFLKFNHLIMSIPSEKVSIEQRLIQVLSVVTLTFNDQFYFISVINPNPISSFVSAFFLWNFVSLLFMIWAMFLKRIIKNQPQTTTYFFTPVRVIVILIFYIIVLAYSVLYAIAQTTDHPVFSNQELKARQVIALGVFALLLFILACVYIIYLLIRVCRERPDRLHRHNIFLAFTIVFFISTFVFFLTGGYNLFNYSAPKIFFTLCFMNMYSFYLQYFYSPTSNQMKKFLSQSRIPKLKHLDQPQDLIQIPQSGEVQICLIQTSQKDEKISNAQNQNQRESQQQRQQESLSARQRRRRNRKKKLVKQANQKAQSNSRIINDQIEQQINQFS